MLHVHHVPMHVQVHGVSRGITRRHDIMSGATVGRHELLKGLEFTGNGISTPKGKGGGFPKIAPHAGPRA